MKTFYEKYPNFIEPDNFQIIRVSNHAWRYLNYDKDPTLPDFSRFVILKNYYTKLVRNTEYFNQQIEIYSKILNRNYCERI